MNLIAAIKHLPSTRHNRKCPECRHANFRYVPRKHEFHCHGCGKRFPKNEIVGCGMSEHPPDYILASPVDGDVPQILASCDKENIDELKELRVKGQHIYKLVGRKA